ncbi:MAG: response regulator [Deltaproteobacteria bacterium]|nr:response regulator [Deltaproteobacteria bacterium]
MGHFDWSTLYGLYSLTGSFISLLIVIYLFHRRSFHGAKQLMFAMSAVSVWSFAYSFEFLSRSLEAKLWWVKIEYLGGAFVGVLFLIFILFIINKEKWLTKTRVVFFLIIPCIIPFVALTNGIHHLMWSAAWLDKSGPAPVVAYQRGMGFWFFVIFTYAFLVAGTGILFRAYLHAARFHRRQILIVLVGVLVPLLSNAFYLFGISPLQHLDLTSFAFTVTGIVIALGLFRFRLLEIVPIARDMVFEGIRDAVIVLDLQDRVLDLNEAARNIVPGNPSTVIRREAREVFPEWFPSAVRIRELKKTHADISIRNNGNVRDYDLSVSPLLDKKKHQIGSLIMLRDITDRKLAEKERQRFQEKLQRAEKMEAVGTLAGGVAHDLNNILMAIVGYPDVLLMQLPEESPLRKPILAIKDSGNKAATIVQDLLTLARRGVSTMEVTNLNRIVTQYLQSPEYEKLQSFHPDIELETRLEKDLLNIMGSPVHLTTTVMNLVSNGFEAMPGGGRVSISTKNIYVDRPVQEYEDLEEGDYVVLSISDNGLGISPEDLKRIFEPFYTKKVMGRSGTGLGMAVAWGTVKDHQGHIDVESKEGEGTTFTLYFPATRSVSTQNEVPLSIEEYSGNGESILVVDDMDSQREIASVLLTQLGYSVDTSASGEEAVEMMQNAEFDLVVLDMIMDPGIDGLDTYKQILALHPGQKAIIASGFSETDRVKAALALGVGQYVKKPYTLQRIGMAVRQELAKSR